MIKYILRRFAVSVPVLIGVTLAGFALINLAPGDPTLALIDPEQGAMLGPDYIDEQRERLGLNDPVIVRYGIWLREIVSGNLGYSLVNGRPIIEMFQDRLWPTFKLGLTALILAVLISVPVGVLSALRQYSMIDYLVTVLSFTAVSIPNFFLALGAIYIFALTLDILPTAGMATVGQPTSFFNSLQHLILPATVIGLSQAAPLIRYVRSSMLEVIRQDYVTVARAKGLRHHVVIYRHALRNALIPFVTILTLSLPNLLNGAIIVETVFAWPGLGRLLINAVHQRDYPVILALNLMFGVLIVVSNLAADILYAVIDPRIRYG